MSSSACTRGATSRRSRTRQAGIIPVVRGQPALAFGARIYIRTLYESQEFNFAGAYGESGFLEDYTARVRGEQIGNVVLVTRNAAGQAQHIVANYRPRDTRLLVSRLIGEHFAGSPYGEHFATSKD